MDLRITTLIENNPDDKKELCFEHGLSLLIEADGKRILFDTGQSGDFIKNATALNQNLENLDFVIISHGHYDHSGGFERLVENVKKVPQVVVGEEFFRQKYKTVSENEYKYNGVSFSEDYLSEKGISLNKVKEDIVYLTQHIMVFHHFKQSNDFEKRNTKFFYKENTHYSPDAFDDEISLGI
ncbi:MAG: MBL fold metallo-hydrolase, partial [Lachnospiraceae bacterium]|nr:MBL fold metallo-hydrolase [Lachnospiraceae bacterium]